MQMHIALHKTFPVDLVRFIEEILNRKVHFLCSEESIMAVKSRAWVRQEIIEK